MAKIFPIIIVIVLAGVGVFLWQSGLLSKLASLNLHFPEISRFKPPDIGSFTIPSSSAPPVPSTQVNTVLENGGGATLYETPVIPTSSIPAGFTRNELSPHFGGVKIDSASAASGYAGSYDEISLSAQFPTGTIDITGWILKGNRGNEYIPQAVNVYDPSGLTAPTDIRLRSEDTLTIRSTVSAIGENLHLNSCIGYITNAANFTPPLYGNCPAPYQDVNMNSLSGECQNYIQSLGNCALPDANPPVPQYDSACQDFLATVNYKGCFDRHRSDSDFLLHQWVAWTNSAFLDPYHDRVALFDKQRLLVDLYSY